MDAKTKRAVRRAVRSIKARGDITDRELACAAAKLVQLRAARTMRVSVAEVERMIAEAGR